MALRPLAFGIRFRDQGRTVRVTNQPGRPRRYQVEDRRRSRPAKQRSHASLAEALADFANTWRSRLN